MPLKTIGACLPLKIRSRLNLGGLVSEHVTLCLALTWWVDLIYPPFRDDVHTFVEAHFWLKALEAVYETKQKKMKSPVQGNLKHLIFLWKKIMYFAVLVKNMLVTLLHIYYLFLFFSLWKLTFPIWHILYIQWNKKLDIVAVSCNVMYCVRYTKTLN